MPFKTNSLLRACLLACLVLSGFNLLAQKKISGKVISNADKQPLIGATVQVKGGKAAVPSNADGSFVIDVPKENSVLHITAVGFDPIDISVAGKTDLGFISMSVANNALNEIIVTGYTVQRKKDITGAVAVVDVKNMKQIPNGSTETLLQGQAAGVQVIASGNPGQGADVRIRGIGSFGNNNPLYIIDGVQGSLHDINPNDIESVQILKDAGAAAIYGVAGANGVVIVTTRKGKSGKSVINYDGFVGTQRPKGGNPFHLLNSPELLTLTKTVDQRAGATSQLYGPSFTMPDYFYNSSAGPKVASAGDPAVDPSKYFFDKANPANDYLIAKANKSGTDWFHEVFKPALQQSHNITASGGNERSVYLFSLNYLDQQGTLINTYLKRYSVRMNTQFNVKDHIRVGENAYVFFKQNPPLNPGSQTGNQNEGNSISYTYREQPIIPVYDIKGNYGGTFSGPELGNGQNPVARQKRTADAKYHVWDIVGNVFGEVDFLKHFLVRTSFGGTIDNQYSDRFTYNAYNDVENHTQLNQFNEDAQYNSTWIWTNTATYSNVFAQHHNLKVFVGTEAKKNTGRGVGGAGNALFNDDPAYWTLSNATQNITNYSNGYITSLVSYFGRLDYAFDDKYLLQVNVRRDGYSAFGSEKTWGNFPSASIGWRISQESFMKNLTWINDMKLRGSYGKLGNYLTVSANNAYTLYGSNFSNSYYDITGSSTSIVQGFYPTQIGSPTTGWETDKITNIGLDATILNNHFDVNLEWYKKQSTGVLFPAILPGVVGGGVLPTVNIANIRNTGIDAAVTYHGAAGRDLRYNIGVNVSHYKAKVVTVPGTGYFDAGSSRIGNFVRNANGHPLGAFFGYKVVGLFASDKDTVGHNQQDEAAGRFIYQDVNHDGKISDSDRTYFGNPNPKFTYGITLNASYKNWDITAFFNGSYGNDLINYVRYWTDFFDAFAGNKSKDLLYNSWSPSNLNAKVPIAQTANSFSTDQVPTSYYLESGSFMKLKNLTIGYTFAPALLKRAGMDRLRVYVQAVNLFTITKYTGLDPELIGSGFDSQNNGNNPKYAAQSSFGIDYGNYPNNQRSYQVGVNLSF